MQLTVKKPNLTSYQKKMLYGEERFTITEASTKVGKTFSHLWWLFELALASNKEGANFWWVAPVYPQAEIAFNRLRRTIAQYGVFQVNISKLSITCPNGAVIMFKSAEKPDNLYGEDVYAVVFDEFTRARQEAWHAIRSTLTKTKGKCKLIGNAKGKKNWGYLLGAKARAGEPNYAYFRVTAYDAANEGIIGIEEIEQAKRDLPERVFKELYLAEPQEDAANPFGFDYIAKCIKPISTKHPKYFGIDLAKSHDYTVIIGLDENGDICYFDRFQRDWEQTTNEVIRVVGRAKALIDGTGVGDPIFERVSKACVNAEQIKYTNTSKQQLMEGLAVAVQRCEISILDGILRDEMEAFEFEYSLRGVKYNAPVGFTDDCVNALALANRCKLFNPSHKTYMKKNSLI